MPGRRGRVVRHLYAFALAATIGGSSAAALVESFWRLERPLGSVGALAASIAISVTVLFLAMLLSFKLTEELVNRGVLRWDGNY
ncbi:MAG: hypothetical protein RXP27_02825 [Nitrososphaeria archaeon]